MSKLQQLIFDLEKLNKDYLELSKFGFPMNEKGLEYEKRRYEKAGKLLIDFYKNKFLPEYALSEEISRSALNRTELVLSYISSQASELISKEKKSELRAKGKSRDLELLVKYLKEMEK